MAARHNDKNPYHLAAQRIRKGQIKWTQHTYLRVTKKPGTKDKVQYECCAEGAVREILYKLFPEQPQTWKKYFEFANEFVQKQTNFKLTPDGSYNGFYSLIGFNDKSDRKRIEVLKMLDDIGDAWDLQHGAESNV